MRDNKWVRRLAYEFWARVEPEGRSPRLHALEAGL